MQTIKQTRNDHKIDVYTRDVKDIRLEQRKLWKLYFIAHALKGGGENSLPRLEKKNPKWRIVLGILIRFSKNKRTKKLKTHIRR